MFIIRLFELNKYFQFIFKLCINIVFIYFMLLSNHPVTSYLIYFVSEYYCNFLEIKEYSLNVKNSNHISLKGNHVSTVKNGFAFTSV